MADAVPAGTVGAATPARGPAAPAPEEGGLLSSKNLFLAAQAIAIFALMQILLGPNSPFGSKQEAVVNNPVEGGLDGIATASKLTVATPGVVPKLDLVSLWPVSSMIDVFVKLSTDVDGKVDFQDSTLPSVSWSGIEYANTKWEREWDTFWNVPISVQHNASLWADIFVTQSGVSPDPASPSANPKDTLHVRKALTRFMPLRKVREVKNLLSGSKHNESEVVPVVDPEAPKEVLPILSYYHQNLSLEIVASPGVVAYSALPPAISEWINVAHEGELDAQGKGFYFPITWANDFWLLRENMNPVNETTTRLPLRITLKPSSYMMFQLYSSLEESMKKQSSVPGGSGGEMDEVKRMLTETNPILLITTVIVSLLHMAFEMLAFTSDISHWRNKKQLVGVSVRTILTNCFVQLIILLYLIDSSESTSWMILFGQGTGLAIEAWKITKAVDIKIIADPTRTIPYKLQITDKHVLSEDELKTQEFDKLAFKYVTWGTVPLLIGYTIYSMVYNEHRGWYSFTISTLTSFVYAFGFIQLVPQLIINYKLKSVAHLPIKTFTYKFFNTIVDDFFSFVIKMPMLHRLACFRDDIVFIILLYQMWIYKVDPNRVNEFGQQLTEEEAAKLLAKINRTDAKEPLLVEGEKVESKKDI